MRLTGEQLELDHFIPTSETVGQILAELRADLPAEIKATPIHVQLCEISPYRWDRDFSIACLNGFYFWKGLETDEADYSDWYSDECFTEPLAAASDAVLWLHQANGFDADAVRALTDALGLSSVNHPMTDIGFETDLENQQFFAPVAFELPEHAIYRSGLDFQIYQEIATDHFHWSGLNDYDRLIGSEAYTEIDEAASDCIFWLHRFSGYDYEDSQTHTYELALPSIRQPEDEPAFIINPTAPNLDYAEHAFAN